MASEDGDAALNVLVDVVGVGIVAALASAAIYVLVGLLLAPVWAAGTVFGVAALRRVGRGWWALPSLARDAGQRLLEPRERRPERPTAEAAGTPLTDRRRQLGATVLWVSAILGGLVFFAVGPDALIRPLAEGQVGEPAAVAVVVLTVVAVAVALVLSRRHGFGNRPRSFRFAMTAVVIGGVLSYLVLNELRYADRLVGDYCSFGAVSQPQLDACEAHVTAKDVRSIDTPAARFAMDDSSDARCGDGSGPFCAEVLNRRYLQDQEPPFGQ